MFVVLFDRPTPSGKQAISHSCTVPMACVQSRTLHCHWGVLDAAGGYSGAEFCQVCPEPCSIRTGTLCWCRCYTGMRSLLYLDHGTLTLCCFTDAFVSHICRMTKLFLSKQMFKWLFNLACSELPPCNYNWVEQEYGLALREVVGILPPNGHK